MLYILSVLTKHLDLPQSPIIKESQDLWDLWNGTSDVSFQGEITVIYAVITVDIYYIYRDWCTYYMHMHFPYSLISFWWKYYNAKW